MQIKLFDTNDIENKLKTRSLYEGCFDEGKNDFIDYYYDRIIRRNQIVVAEEEGKILSMIHLNPYFYNICGEVHRVHYLVAIATSKEYRNRGLMSKIMNFSIEYLKSLQDPFCYIVPECKEYEIMYGKYGFSSVCKFTLDKFSKDKYDIFPDDNPEYRELMNMEQYFLDLESEDYKSELSKKMVLFRILNENVMMSIEELRKKSIYVCQEV